MLRIIVEYIPDEDESKSQQIGEMVIIGNRQDTHKTNSDIYKAWLVDSQSTLPRFTQVNLLDEKGLGIWGLLRRVLDSFLTRNIKSSKLDLKLRHKLILLDDLNNNLKENK